MEPLYRPPDGTEYLQGDIFAQVPSVVVRDRPLVAGRLFREDKEGRVTWGMHAEDGRPPRDGFKWSMEQDGEEVIVHCYLEMAMLLSHDCEIENDQNLRTLAMVRPAAHLDEASRSAVFKGRAEGEYYALFPLREQVGDPGIPLSFVDFRRLTTVKPNVLAASTRVASISDALRNAVADAFWDFLFRGNPNPAARPP